MTKTELFVGAVVRRDGEVLLVRQSAGHSLAGQWTVPWGHVGAGESPMAAAIREVHEEAGVEVDVEALLGVQELPEPQLGGVALVYLCRHISGNPTPQGTETDAARYFDASAFRAWAEPKEPWSAWLVQRVFSDELTLIRSASTNPLQPKGAFL
jgi:mutator protein MutT